MFLRVVFLLHTSSCTFFGAFWGSTAFCWVVIISSIRHAKKGHVAEQLEGREAFLQDCYLAIFFYPPKFNSSPLKKLPFQKERRVFQASILQGLLLVFRELRGLCRMLPADFRHKIRWSIFFAERFFWGERRDDLVGWLPRFFGGEFVEGMQQLGFLCGGKIVGHLLGTS